MSRKSPSDDEEEDEGEFSRMVDFGLYKKYVNLENVIIHVRVGLFYRVYISMITCG